MDKEEARALGSRHSYIYPSLKGSPTPTPREFRRDNWASTDVVQQ